MPAGPVLGGGGGRLKTVEVAGRLGGGAFLATPGDELLGGGGGGMLKVDELVGADCGPASTQPGDLSALCSFLAYRPP